MDVIMMLVKAVLYFASIVIGLFVLLFPVLLDVYMRENMKVRVLNYWLSFIGAICMLGVITNYESAVSAS